MLRTGGKAPSRRLTAHASLAPSSPQQDAPFFTVKLGIKVLPAVVMFDQGVAVGRIVGFDQLGGKDDFSTTAIEARLRQLGMLKPLGSGAGEDRTALAGSDSEGDGEGQRREPRSVRHGFHSVKQRGEEDESSDFD